MAPTKRTNARSRDREKLKWIYSKTPFFNFFLQKNIKPKLIAL